MKKYMLAIAAISTIAMSATTCFAQEVVFTGEEAPIPVYQSSSATKEEQPEMVNVEKLNVLGVADGMVVVEVPAVPSSTASTDEETTGEAGAESTVEATETAEPTSEAEGEEKVGFVMLEDILTIIPSLDYTSLPTVGEWTDLGQGARGDAVAAAQEALIGLGILEGSADGKFGPATGGAISAFQTEKGLPVTGVLDLKTYFTIIGGESETLTVPYPPAYKVEDKFANILPDVQDADILEAFVTPHFGFSFDAFEGDGLIFTDTVLGTYEEASRPIDTISIIVSPDMKVKREDNGVISVKPVLHVESIGAYRPYVKSLILKAGNTVKEVEATDVSGKLLDTQVSETADLEINVDEIKELVGKGDLEVRLKGNSREYDLNVSASVEEVLEALGQE